MYFNKFLNNYYLYIFSNNYSIIFSTPIIFITSIIIIYFSINKQKKIIDDIGYVKCQLLLIGVLCFFISINFSIFKNYVSCAINFFLKHCGILLIIIIYFLFISTGNKLGISHEKIEKINLNIFQYQSENSIDNDISKENNIYPQLNINIEKELNINNSMNITNNNTKNKKSYSDNNINTKENINDTTIKILNKGIFYIHSIHIEIIFIYIFVVFTLIFMIYYYSKQKNKFIQEYNKKWRYQCPLIKLDLAMCVIELLFINYILYLVIKIWNYTFIFKCIKYIGYSIIIWVIIGPLFNVRI